MAVEHLTERRVAQIKPTTKVAYYYYDEDRGLCLKVAPTGRRWWLLKVDYRKHGQKVSTRIKLGDANFLSLASARQQARSMKARVAAGLTPVEEAPQTLTLQRAWDDYREELVAKGRSPKTIEGYAECLRIHMCKFLPLDLHYLGSDEGRALLVDLHRSLTRQGKKSTADGVMRVFRAIYRRARRINTSLPESPTQAISFNNVPGRKRVVKDLSEWSQIVGTLSNPLMADLYWIAMLTGAREATICEAKIEEIDLESGWWHIPNPKGGASRAYDVPLSDMAKEIFARRIEEARQVGSDYIFWSRHSKSGHIVETKPYDKRLPNIHTYRSSFISYAVDAGVPDVLRKLLTNHKLGNDAHSGYIRGSVLGESLQAAQQRITDYVMQRASPELPVIKLAA